MGRSLLLLLPGLLVSSIMPESTADSTRLSRDDCEIPDDQENTGYLLIESDASGAFAGVRASDLCCVDDNYYNETIGDYGSIQNDTFTLIVYQAMLANQTTSFDWNTTEYGCDFSDGLCTDPTFRQQLADADACTWTGTNRQIADRLMLTLNRPNWLYALPDDNYCVFRMADNRTVLAAKVNIDNAPL